jgi:hypothetical protein
LHPVADHGGGKTSSTNLKAKELSDLEHTDAFLFDFAGEMDKRPSDLHHSIPQIDALGRVDRFSFGALLKATTIEDDRPHDIESHR